MSGDSEYEPKDSRNVTGQAHTKDGRWSGDEQPAGHGGEYEPRDSRTVTGTTPDERRADDKRKSTGADEGSQPSDAGGTAVHGEHG